MNGPSEFHCIGSLRTWDITDRLHEITTPTLLVSGRHDEATPHIVEQIQTRIPGAAVAALRRLEPYAARGGAGGFPRNRAGIPEDGRLTAGPHRPYPRGRRRLLIGPQRPRRADFDDTSEPGRETLADPRRNEPMQMNGAKMLPAVVRDRAIA